ncbi:cbb3-type cytochrome oxidase assembly protein CcoS [Pseudobdellovibrio exovorus]|uniref:Cytochrome oxidase maturation protein, cbb3-type n=1 Tax=Pseudobdellovibrio exovorus JSS TaxID=1184267 RepID=M4V899_9BACT|nr:cbb3-type cytochrome oxidase assembly protein CcoS [Pseudobdellovibrio exovorus]AGH95438.1 cytochrome oxidase maturation protein, cbb3-type [Pseudobdellovibrio exovorus JSS]
MNVTILFMVAIALYLALGFVVACLWALEKGQFDDLETPALRILKNDDYSDFKERDS